MIKKILVVFVFSSTLLFVFAQNNNSAVVTSPQVKSEIIATVNITNATSTQKDHVFTINFDISNDVGIQPDVHYGVSLVKIESGKQEIIDERVYSDSLILDEGEKIHKTITYQAPESFSGVYSLRLMSKNSRAIPLAFAMLGDVNLEEAKNGSIYINPTTCHLVISNGKDPKNQSINDLFLITKNDTLELSCTIKNTTKSEVTLTPSLIQNKRNAYGDTVTSVSGSTGISIAPGQSKQMYISIPKVIEPQSYYVSAFFRDQTTKTETNKIAFRYYLEGTGASIRTLLLDKDNWRRRLTPPIDFHTLLI